MIIGTFAFFFILFIVIFSLPSLKNKKKSNIQLKYLAIPVVCSVGMTFLSVLKVYFIYKLLVLLFFLVI
jgi:hypothetical protein